jgi:hypothetical protein
MRVALTIAAIGCLTGVATSQPVVTSFTGGSNFAIYYGGSTGDVVGFRFTSDVDQMVTDLGVLEDLADGVLDSPHMVGLWRNSDMALLASATVDSGDTLIDGFFYTPVAPVLLEAGVDYTLGALYTADDTDSYISTPTTVVLYQISNTNGVYPAAGDLGFIYPELDSTNLARFGPNAIVGPAVPVGGCCQCNGDIQFCTVETEEDCVALEGEYLGDDTDCSGDPCADAFPNQCVTTIFVPLDIKPGSCPNPMNRGSNGVLPVAVVGTDEFDVTLIDLATVVLYRGDGLGGTIGPNMGPPGPHPTLEDVTGPFMGDPCDCDELGLDGVMDLSLKFRTSDLVEALMLGDLPAGALVPLCVGGFLTDGTPFEGCDCVWLVPPGNDSDGMLIVQSNLADVWLKMDPADDYADYGGFTNYNRFYSFDTVIHLQAPLVPTLWPNLVLKGWWINGEYHPDIGEHITVTLDTPFVDVAPWYGRQPRPKMHNGDGDQDAAAH